MDLHEDMVLDEGRKSRILSLFLRRDTLNLNLISVPYLVLSLDTFFYDRLLIHLLFLSLSPSSPQLLPPPSFLSSYFLSFFIPFLLSLSFLSSSSNV